MVEHDHERERAIGLFLPMGEFAALGRIEKLVEARSDRRVENIILGEPFLASGLAPEGDHVGGGGEWHHVSEEAEVCGSPKVRPGNAMSGAAHATPFGLAASVTSTTRFDAAASLP